MNFIFSELFHPLVFTLIIGCFGLVIGSFLNVLIWRLPKEQSINGRSQCPNCKTVLKAIDLIPILSYLFYRGHCRYCPARISARYPLIELITGIAFGLIAWFLLPAGYWQLIILLKALFFVAVLVVVFVVDLEHYLILDRVIFPSIVVVFVLNLVLDLITKPGLSLNSLIISGLIGSIIAAGFFYILWLVSQGRWIGFGDVKFGFLLGLFFGFPMVIISLFLGFLIGTAVSIPLLVLNKKGLKSQLPLGTFLA